ncbi:MAG: hypothetical protein JO322_15965 [Candidatus Eremiobacteraeota bacterium]|nr:hypothetical protein [Candidatus Eremiobacteraeota bacterium]
MASRRVFLQSILCAATAPILGAVTSSREAVFTPDDVRADLDSMWTAMLDVGVYPFRTSNRTSVERGYRQARAAIVKPMTLREAWVAIAPVFGALNDGHVSLAFTQDLNDAARRFPLWFALSDANDALILAGDRTGTIPPGSSIVSVEGVGFAALRNLTLAAFGAQTAVLHRARVTTSGAWPAIALFGALPQYTVRYISDGKTADAVVSSADTTGTAVSGGPPYTYATLANGSVGYIEYRSCEDFDRFRTFLQTTFQTIEDHPVRALVIDIRQNGGGDSALNDLLWTYVSNKPFKQYGGTIEKSCARLKSEYGKDRYVQVYGDEAWDAPEGTILTLGMNPDDGLIIPQAQPLRYSGPVYLLISTHTFSSAMSCALAAKDYGLATIVGEETGEPVNSTGEIYEFIAPATKLPLYLTTKYFLAPKPHPDGQGVIPDVIVPTQPQDRAAGRDAVLDKALALAASAG